MSTYKHHETGQRYEREAYEYLHEKGFKLLERNYQCKLGEIDLVMRDKDDVVFVEVRSRHSTEYGSALESITRSKIRKLVKTATHFLMVKKWLNKVNCRFDVIAISPVNGKMKLEWIKHAFTVET